MCIYHRLQSTPSCKHPGLQLVPLNRAELFQDISTSRTGKTSKQLQHNRKKQGADHNQNVLPKCSTTLLTSPPALLIIYYGQENSPKYNFLFVFSLLESLQKYSFSPTAKLFYKLLQNQASQACLDSVYQTNIFHHEITRKQ